MIERYTRPEMASIWGLENRFSKMWAVELAVAEVQSELGIIPSEAAKEIRARGQFSVERIAELEKTTKHDVIAFVSNVAENVGEMGRYIHFGMTSSDVLDTALGLQIREGWQVLQKSLDRLSAAYRVQIEQHRGTVCAGRTHGMFAEPTTWGLKMAGHWAELNRHRDRLERAIEQTQVVKLSGAVGTYSGQPPEVERKVGERLGLIPETVATQVVPRDRHAEMMVALAQFGCGLERWAVEFRHLQRSEVAEVTEGFSKGQKGSSAMPHKKNPISAENISGLARLLRSYAMPALENIALWHERDISHSSVERVLFPDAFILADYAADRMATLVEGITVDAERMLRNMEASQGQLFSSQVLLALVAQGLEREKAYEHVQRLSHSLKPGEQLEAKVLSDAETSRLLSPEKVRQIFSGAQNQEKINGILDRLLSSQK